MRKLVLSAFFLASVFHTALGATEGVWTYTLANNLVTVTGYTGTGGVVIMPTTLGGYPVTAIGNSAFYNKTTLTNIIIPQGVTSIGNSVFAGCTSLTSIIIPDSVTSIGTAAFSQCVSLTGASIGKSVTTIGGSAFVGCANLASVNLPIRFKDSYSSFSLSENQARLYGSKSEIDILITSNITTGQQSVLTSPNTYNLYSTSQIQNMAVGDLVLTRTNGSNLVLNYDIEQSEDLQTWTTYQGYALPLTNLPTNKAFVRIKAKQ